MIHKTVQLPCGIQRAFSLFTERIGDWWPEARRHTKDPKSRMFLGEDGRFWELASDGREAELGRVVQWQPPTRLVVDFFAGTGPEFPTELEVCFREEDGGTLVEIFHRPTPVSQALWDKRVAIFHVAWPQVAQAFGEFVGRSEGG